MDVFPKINEFELAHAHALVDLLVLRRGFVQIESGFPLFGVHRREGAQHDFPFGDGQAGPSEPGDAAYDNLYKNHDHADQQPEFEG